MRFRTPIWLWAAIWMQRNRLFGDWLNCFKVVEGGFLEGLKNWLSAKRSSYSGCSTEFLLEVWQWGACGTTLRWSEFDNYFWRKRWTFFSENFSLKWTKSKHFLICRVLPEMRQLPRSNVSAKIHRLPLSKMFCLFQLLRRRSPACGEGVR